MISQRDKYIYSGAVVIIVGLGMLFIRSQPKDSESPEKQVTYHELELERKRAESTKKMDRQRTEVQNWQTAPKLNGNMHPVKNELEEGSAKIRLESAKNHAAIDSADVDVNEMPFSSLESQINKRMINEQHAAQMSQIQKRRFVEDYKKRALAMGYQVELNDKLELVRATKVRQPSYDSQKVPVDVDSMEEDYDEYEEE
jgi:hypothetical protein